MDRTRNYVLFDKKTQRPRATASLYRAYDKKLPTRIFPVVQRCKIKLKNPVHRSEIRAVIVAVVMAGTANIRY